MRAGLFGPEAFALHLFFQINSNVFVTEELLRQRRESRYFSAEPVGRSTISISPHKCR